jgi:hypothetical protein
MRRPGDFVLIPVGANGQPALAVYLRGRDGRYLAHAIQVLTPTGAGLARIVSFNEPRLFAMFGLAAVRLAGWGRRRGAKGAPARLTSGPVTLEFSTEHSVSFPRAARSGRHGRRR